MHEELENGFDGFMKNFENTSAENIINELEELGVTFVHVEGVKFNHEEEQSKIKTQSNKSDIL